MTTHDQFSAMPSLVAFPLPPASCRRITALRSTALAGGVLAALLAASPALAQNATWSAMPGTGDFNTGTNWIGGVVPTGTATFGATNNPGLSVTGNFELGGFTFNAGAPAYTFTFNVNRGHGFLGAGIVNGRNQTFVVNASQFQFINSATAGEASFTVNSGLRFSNTSTAGASTITTIGGGFGGAGTGFDSTSSGGTSTHIIGTNGLLYIDSYGGAGVTIGSLEGLGTVAIGGKTLTIGSNDKSTTYSGVIQNRGRFVDATVAGNLVKTGTGTLTLAGTNAYTGTTTVDGGTLLVNGSIATSSGLTVNNGGTVGGTGTLPGTTIATGGTLAPGNSVGTLSVNGALNLNAGSTTAIEVQGATIDRINVTGAATLGGTVKFIPTGGTYTFNNPYTFLQAASVTGAFGAQQVQGSFGEGVTTTVTTTATEAQLTLKPAPLVEVIAPAVVAPAKPATLQGTTSSQLRVAAAIDRAVAAGGNASPFFNLYNQNRAGILGGLDQISGVAHTGASMLGNQASGAILTAMLNPIGAGRSAPTSALVRFYAPEQALSAAQRAISEARGLPVDMMASFQLASIYNVWASVTGATGRVNGETATGSPRSSSGMGGVSVGVDISVAPETVVGVALAGARATSSTAQGLGSTETDLFQVGLYGSTRFGALSLSAAGAWTTGQVEGSRSIGVLGVSNVTSNYNMQGFSGRLEAAYAMTKVSGLTLSPYAAFQASSIRTASFIEKNALTGLPFGLQVSAKTNAAARTELGIKLETNTQLGAMPATAFVRAAWGLNTSRDVQVTAQLVGLPGSVFTVSGTRPDRHVALLAAGGEVKLTQTVTLGSRVDAELGSRARTVQGSASVRVAF